MKKIAKVIGFVSGLYIAYRIGYHNGAHDQFVSAKQEFEEYRKQKKDTEDKLINICEYYRLQKNIMGFAWLAEKEK